MVDDTLSGGEAEAGVPSTASASFMSQTPSNGLEIPSPALDEQEALLELAKLHIDNWDVKSESFACDDANEEGESFWTEFDSALDSLRRESRYRDGQDVAHDEGFMSEDTARPNDSLLSEREDIRIPAHLRPYVAVGVHGGLVFKPKAVLDVDASDPNIAEAYKLVAKSLFHTDAERDNAKSDVFLAGSSEIRCELFDDDDDEEEEEEEEEEENIKEQSSLAGEEIDKAFTRSEFGSDKLDPSLKLSKFDWMDSESRKILIEFGTFVREQITEKERIEKENAEITRARAAAASARVRAEGDVELQGVESKKKADRKEDPLIWAARQEAATRQISQAVSSASQKRKRGSSSGGLSGMFGMESSDSSSSLSSSLWSFFVPKSTKQRSEAAAEMARARIAAAAAMEAMREDFDSGNNSGPADDRESDNAPRRTLSAPPGSLDSRLACDSQNDASGAQVLNSTHPPPLLPLDDFGYFARAKGEDAQHGRAQRRQSRIGNRSFARPLSEKQAAALAAHASQRKKRVSFSSNTVYNYEE